MLQIPKELDGVVLLDNIKLLYNEYMLEEATQSDDQDTDVNLKTQIASCRSTCLNPYLTKVIESCLDGETGNLTYTQDDVNYFLVMLQLLKNYPIFLEFISLLPNIYIPNQALNGTPGYTISNTTQNSIQLNINIESVTVFQLSYFIQQLIKSVLSMTLIASINIKIQNATSIIYAQGQSIISTPVVRLSSKYAFAIASLAELLNGTS